MTNGNGVSRGGRNRNARLARGLPQPDSGQELGDGPDRVCLDQDGVSTLHPQRDSNPCYRRERATEAPPDIDENL